MGSNKRQAFRSVICDSLALSIKKHSLVLGRKVNVNGILCVTIDDQEDKEFTIKINQIHYHQTTTEENDLQFEKASDRQGKCVNKLKSVFTQTDGCCRVSRYLSDTPESVDSDLCETVGASDTHLAVRLDTPESLIFNESPQYNDRVTNIHTNSGQENKSLTEAEKIVMQNIKNEAELSTAAELCGKRKNDFEIKNEPVENDKFALGDHEEKIDLTKSDCNFNQLDRALAGRTDKELDNLSANHLPTTFARLTPDHVAPVKPDPKVSPVSPDMVKMFLLKASQLGLLHKFKSKNGGQTDHCVAGNERKPVECKPKISKTDTGVANTDQTVKEKNETNVISVPHRKVLEGCLKDQNEKENGTPLIIDKENDLKFQKNNNFTLENTKTVPIIKVGSISSRASKKKHRFPLETIHEKIKDEKNTKVDFSPITKQRKLSFTPTENMNMLDQGPFAIAMQKLKPIHGSKEKMVQTKTPDNKSQKHFKCEGVLRELKPPENHKYKKFEFKQLNGERNHSEKPCLQNNSLNPKSLDVNVEKSKYSKKHFPDLPKPKKNDQNCDDRQIANPEPSPFSMDLRIVPSNFTVSSSSLDSTQSSLTDDSPPKLYSSAQDARDDIALDTAPIPITPPPRHGIITDSNSTETPTTHVVSPVPMAKSCVVNATETSPELSNSVEINFKCVASTDNIAQTKSQVTSAFKNCNLTSSTLHDKTMDCMKKYPKILPKPRLSEPFTLKVGSSHILPKPIALKPLSHKPLTVNELVKSNVSVLVNNDIKPTKRRVHLSEGRTEMSKVDTKIAETILPVNRGPSESHDEADNQKSIILKANQKIAFDYDVLSDGSVDSDTGFPSHLISPRPGIRKIETNLVTNSDSECSVSSLPFKRVPSLKDFSPVKSCQTDENSLGFDAVFQSNENKSPQNKSESNKNSFAGFGQLLNVDSKNDPRNKETQLAKSDKKVKTEKRHSVGGLIGSDSNSRKRKRCKSESESEKSFTVLNKKFSEQIMSKVLQEQREKHRDKSVTNVIKHVSANEAQEIMIKNCKLLQNNFKQDLLSDMKQHYTEGIFKRCDGDSNKSRPKSPVDKCPNIVPRKEARHLLVLPAPTAPCRSSNKDTYGGLLNHIPLVKKNKRKPVKRCSRKGKSRQDSIESTPRLEPKLDIELDLQSPPGRGQGRAGKSKRKTGSVSIKGGLKLKHRWLDMWKPGKSPT